MLLHNIAIAKGFMEKEKNGCKNYNEPGRINKTIKVTHIVIEGL